MRTKTERATTVLHPIHPGTIRAPRIKPRNMSSITLDPELRMSVERIALEIFTDACNAGVPFVSALTALYLSGIDHGINGLKEV